MVKASMLMVPKEELQKRQKQLIKQLKQNSIVIICSNTLQVRSNDTHYPFRQNSNFYYLTGFKEDSSALIIVKKKKKYKTFFFVHPKDPQKELWDGKRLGVKTAKKLFWYDEVYSYEDFDKVLKKVSQERSHCYYSFKNFHKKSLNSISHHHDIDPFIYHLRLYKTPYEIKQIQKALSITKQAHIKAMQLVKDGLYEYQVQAEFEYIFKKNGAYSDAYTTIVAGGNNANTLHYIQNDQKLQNGDLVLIDAGCEYNYYASDITRTIPVGGTFTKEQKEIYTLVLHTQKEILSMIQPGVLRSTLQQKAQELLTQGMCELGILRGNLKKLLAKKSFYPYYPHGIGHFMGIDVHDQNPYKTPNGEEIPLQEGMVLTIEPGLYLPKEDKKIPKRYRGIGVRIEDNILITKDGYKNLSKDIPKEIADIEALYNT